MENDRAVLLVAYGTPETLDDVEAYFTHIRGGRKPPPDAVEHLRARYERVGGGTPLRRITESVRAKLETTLKSRGAPQKVYIGMRHWHPYIADVVRAMHSDGVRDVIVIALAPHYSRMSVGAYRDAVEAANKELPNPLNVRVVERWYDHPKFVKMMTTLVRDALKKFPTDERDSVMVIFTAHSLPVRIREWSDPYEEELLESSAMVAREADIRQWRFAWQSAGGSHEPWIGPDILEYLETLKAEGVQNVLQVPIGFVSDHLEVLYDIDIEAKEKARLLGMVLERTALPNDSPALIETLADVVTSGKL